MGSFMCGSFSVFLKVLHFSFSSLVSHEQPAMNTPGRALGLLLEAGLEANKL